MSLMHGTNIEERYGKSALNKIPSHSDASIMLEHDTHE